MPIKDVFAAAAGAAPSLNGIAMTGPVDLTDGSWTLLDPDSLVDTVSFDGTHNTITWNALAAGSNDYVWDAGANHRAPRWYKALEIDSTRMTTDEVIDAVMVIQNDDTLRDFPNKVVAGPCVDPTSTVGNTIGGMGALASALITGSVTDYGVWSVTSSASTNSPSGVRGMITSQYGGRHTGSGVFTILNSTDQRVQNGSRNGAVVLASTTNLNWMVGAGARGSGNTWAAGVTNRFRIDYTAVKVTLP